MKSRNLQIFISTFVYCCALILGALPLYFLMKYCADESILFPIAGMALLFGAIILCIVNAFVKNRLYKKFSDENATEIIKFANNMREEVLKDYLATEKAVIKCKNRLILYKVLLSLYFFAMIAVSAVGTADDNPLRAAAIIVALIGVFIYPLPILDLFLTKSYSRAPESCISREQFPLLFSVVDDAKRTLNCNKNYIITPVIGSGVSVSSWSDGFCVSLDAEETALLTRDELYQIMLHEIAHVINSDTKRSLRLERFSNCLNTRLGSIIVTLFYIKPFVDFLIKKQAYYVFCNIFYEQNADKAVKEYGNGQTYINGTAKSMTLAMYNDEYNPEMDFDIHKSENLPKDYLFYDLQIYEKYSEKYEDKWNYLLTHRIQSRSDSHPTFMMRKDFMGADSYDFKKRETDERYIDEQQRLLKWGCDYLVKYTNDDFRRARAEYYLPTLKKIENYRAAAEAGQTFSVMEKSEYIETFFGIDRDECLKLCNEVLSDCPRNAYANFYKGKILAQNLDKNCVEYLYVAAEENTNFSEAAYNIIGLFACNTGDEELLESYRNRFDNDMIDLYRRNHEAFNLDKNEDIRANALDKVDYDNVLNFILDSGKNIVDKIYSVSRGEGEEMRTFYYIETLNSVKFKEKDEFFDKVFDYLDRYVSAAGFEPSFSLFVDNCDKKMKKLIKDTSDSLIYSKEVSK